MKCRSRIRGGCAAVFGCLLVPVAVYGQVSDPGVAVAEDGPALIGGQGPAIEEPVQQVPTDPGPSWQWPGPANPSPGGQSRSFSTSEDGSSYRYDRTMTNPQGEMTKTWERTATEEGTQWSREHRWTSPDGEVTRQHQWSGSQTDPYNYQREKSMLLPGGRTMTHTQSRTWDGESGTMERTFQGPNGQYREHSRPWTPDNLQTPGETESPAGDATASSAETDQPETGLFGKLKAWGKRTFGSRDSGEKSMRRSGFSVGSASRSQASARASHDAVPKQNPGRAVSGMNRQNPSPHSNSSSMRPAGSRPGKSR